MRKFWLFLPITFYIFSFCAYSEEYEENPRLFFPQRPNNVKLHHMEGLITGYSCCYYDSSLLIKSPDGKEQMFFLSLDTKFNGKEIECSNDGESEEDKERNCKNWPKEFVLGKTKVVVTWWYQKRYGSKEEPQKEGETMSHAVFDYSTYTMEKSSDQIDLAK